MGNQQRWMLQLWITQIFLLAVMADSHGTWNCKELSKTVLGPNVTWTKLNCSGVVQRHWLPGVTHIGPIIVNIASALLSPDAASPKLRPQIAMTEIGLAKLHQLAGNASTPDFTPVAGVNGGYFFEVNRQDFLDDVCWGKDRRDALRNVSLTEPNSGIGDSLTLMNGKYMSSNCDKLGNSKPVVAILDYPPRFEKLKRGERAPPGTQWAIAAGPNLVSRDSGSTASRVDIEGDNVNILEHASNTGLALKGSQFMVVTMDGIDGCVEYKPTCGVNSWQFASFLLDHLEVETAMEMDQGGSTAMWVAGQPNNGIVSNPGVEERQLFNGIFIGV